MRRIAIALMSTVSGLVLLFCYHTSLGPETLTPLPAGGGSGGQGGADAAGAAPSTDAGASPSGAGAAQSPAQGGVPNGTFTGDVADTQWGPVQVKITIRNGKITDAVAVQYPNGNHHDDEINSWAIPQLQQATIQANGAHIDSLSGATVTSGGYITSLQSALDKAHA